MSEFENIVDGLDNAHFRCALIDVFDTLDIVRLYFDARRIPVVAADLLTATATILDRERRYREDYTMVVRRPSGLDR